jgi:hypothetical protein
MSFAIGTAIGTITDLKDLGTPVEYPKSVYLQTATTQKTGANTKRGFGLPAAYWTFPLMTIEERNQLKTFCPAYSAEVYITTKLDDDSFATFQCTMNWMDDDTSGRWFGNRKEIVVEFVNLVEVVP